MPLCFADVSVQLMAGGEKQGLCTFLVFHFCVIHSSLCLVGCVSQCIVFQHKNLESVIKKHWFYFMFCSHLTQGETNDCESHFSPSVSARAKIPLGQF